MEEHKNFLHSKHPEKSDDWITNEQTRNFSGWLQKRAMHGGDIEDDMYSLSQLHNGNIFYTIAQDKKSTNQNSGARFDATTKTWKETYYGYIEDIWELNYGGGLKVPLFRCKWVNMTRGGVTKYPQYGMTTVDLNNLAYADRHVWHIYLSM